MITRSITTPLRLRSLGADPARKVTWLELFFDLVFVAAVAQVAAPLHTEYSLAGLVRFTPLFALISDSSEPARRALGSARRLFCLQQLSGNSSS